MRHLAAEAQEEPKPTNIRTKFLTVLPLVLLLLPLAIGLYRASTIPSFPDEVNFLGIGNQWQSDPQTLLPENTYGYGSTFWLLLALVSKIFSPVVLYKQDLYISTTSTGALQALFAVKVLAVTSLYAALAYSILKARTNTARWALALLALLPVFWWDGKWVTPDFFAMAAFVVAGSAIARKKAYLPIIALAFATGMKTTNVFLAFGFVVLALFFAYRNDGVLRGAAKSIAAGIGGYLLANPFLAVNPAKAIENAQGIAAETGPSWKLAYETAGNIVWRGGVEWDSAKIGSLISWFGSPLVIVGLVLVAIFYRQYALALCSIVGAALLTAVVAFRGLGYGWYYMPLVAVTFVALTSQLPSLTKVGRFAKASLVILLVGALASIPRSEAQLATIFERDNALKDVASQQACLEEKIPRGLPVFSMIDAVVIPQPLLDMRDTKPAYEAMRLWMTDTVDPNTLVMVTTPTMVEQTGWITNMWSRVGVKVNCGDYWIGVPETA